MTILEIITIGDELVEGTWTNTNGSWIAEKLTEAGGQVKKITTIGDDVNLIAKEINRSINEEADLLILTGGLGPTTDDKTMEALSKAIGKGRKIDEKALKMVRKSYERLAQKGQVKEEDIRPPRKKMAKIPAGTIPIKNPVGGAPAVLAEVKKTKILCLPGVPDEMKAILMENIDDLGIKENKRRKPCKTFEVENIGESALAPLYEEIEEKFSSSEVRSYPIGKGSEGKIFVKLYGSNKEELEEIEKYFLDLLHNFKGVSAKTVSSLGE